MTENGNMDRFVSAIKATGWQKLVAIMAFLNGITLIFGCITIPLAILSFLAGMRLWSASDSLSRFTTTKNPQDLYDGLDNISEYFKWMGILTVVGIVTGLIFFVIYFIFIVGFLSQFGTLD